VPVIAGFLALLAALALGGCAMPDFDSFQTPDATTIFRPLSVTGTKERTLAAVTAENMVDAEGRCAGTLATSGASDGAPPDQGAGPVISPGIAIDMTECDVVKRAGVPDQVAIGANERGERTATLTFLRGARPGIYHFTAGRLTLMERAPEPPPQPGKRAPRPRAAQASGR
jgi:hypothetical protein